MRDREGLSCPGMNCLWLPHTPACLLPDTRARRPPWEVAVALRRLPAVSELGQAGVLLAQPPAGVHGGCGCWLSRGEAPNIRRHNPKHLESSVSPPHPLPPAGGVANLGRWREARSQRAAL